MIFRVVAVRDRAADVFGQPNFVLSIGGAIRAFGDEVNRAGDPNNSFNKHPEDFDLYEIGSYNDETGEMVAIHPRQIAVGKDLVRS